MIDIKLTEKEKVAREKWCMPLDGLITLEECEVRIEEIIPKVSDDERAIENRAKALLSLDRAMYAIGKILKRQKRKGEKTIS